MEIGQQRANQVLSQRDSVPQGNNGFHQCHWLTARHDPSFAKHDLVMLVPQPKWEGPECHWQACGFSCWSRCQYCELCKWHGCELPWRTDLLYPYGNCFAPCTAVTTLSAELPKNQRKVAALSDDCHTQASEHIEVNQSPTLNLCLSNEKCNSHSRRDVCVQRHVENYKERLDPDSWLPIWCFSYYATLPSWATFQNRWSLSQRAHFIFHQLLVLVGDGMLWHETGFKRYSSHYLPLRAGGHNKKGTIKMNGHSGHRLGGGDLKNHLAQTPSDVWIPSIAPGDTLVRLRGGRKWAKIARLLVPSFSPDSSRI